MFLNSESIDGFPKKSKSSFVLPKIFPGVYEIPQNNWTRSGEHKQFHKSMDTQTKYSAVLIVLLYTYISLII